jgi:predicted O-methyltransferase YrrM
MNTALREAAFTSLVNALQQHVVPLFVRLRKRRRARNVPLPSDRLRTRLAALGLDVERMWWGPMTLFPFKLEFLMDEIEARPPRMLLEVGSGSSTPLLAALANRYGFDIVSLENYAPSAAYVRQILAEGPGAARVQLLVSGFRRRHYPDGRRYWWYDIDLSRFAQPFDFVVIDGPMSSLVGRNGALPEIMPYLANSHRIYLDDATRPHELHCVDEWKKYYTGMQVERPAGCPGILKLRVTKPDT